MLLGTKDTSIHSTLEKTRLKYTHSDIQNKLDLMTQHVLLDKITEILETFLQTNTLTSADMNKHSCLRTVCDNLEIQEDFLSFYELNDIKSDSIVHAIKNVLFWSNFSLQHCWVKPMTAPVI